MIRLCRIDFSAARAISLVDQARRAADEGEFAPEPGPGPGPGLFLPGATSSFKQVQFGEANVQLTFHEKDTRKIDGVDCVKAGPDIDFMDGGAHTLLEGIPNTITHGETEPKKVYALRRICRPTRRCPRIRSTVNHCSLTPILEREQDERTRETRPTVPLPSLPALALPAPTRNTGRATIKTPALGDTRKSSLGPT
jgi:hypothetical protein